MKLFRRPGSQHQPDGEALSALMDGRLASGAAAALEQHVGGCEACASRLGELRSTQALLVSMPEPEPPRSFRLRAADVEVPVRAGGVPRAVRWAPALAMSGVVVFGVVVAIDLSGDDGGAGSPGSVSRYQEAADGASELSGGTALSGVTAMDDGGASATTITRNSASEPGAGSGAEFAATPCASCATAPSDRAVLETPVAVDAPAAAPAAPDAGVAENAAPPAGTAPEPPPSGDALAEGESGGTAPSPEKAAGTDSAATSATEIAELEQRRLEAITGDDGDDGTDVVLRTIEVAAAAVAIAAGGTALWWWWRRRSVYG